MKLARHLSSLLLAWILGVAWQLQQPTLWPWQIYLSLVVLGLCLLGLGWRWGRRGMPDYGVFLLVLSVGLSTGFGLTGARATWYASQALAPQLQGLDIEVTGRVASLPQRGELGDRFELLVESARHGGETVRLPRRIQLSWYQRGAAREREGLTASGAEGGGATLSAGERWRMTVRLRSPHGQVNPHGFDRERWLWEQGIGATGYVRDGPRDARPQRLGATAWHPVETAREWVVRRIKARVIDVRSAGVLAALVAGEQSAIERDDWDLFRTTGVAHLMSISGLHVTMFAWLAMAGVGLLWRQLARVQPRALLAVPTPLAAGVGGVALAAAYALFSGWGVPSQRTVLMLAVVVGLRLSGRQWPWPLVWLLAMSAVLLLDPWALLQPGFWLSFVAVGILFATDPGRRTRLTADGDQPPRHRRVWRAAVGMVREQSVVTVALAPLALLLFGQFSLVGLVANLLAIPWVTLVITPLAMLGVAAPPLWDAAALAVQGMSAGLTWLAQWPWASIFRPVPPAPLALAAVLGGGLVVLRLPGVFRGAGLLLLWPALLWAPARPAPGEFELLAIDVGQGSAALVRTAHHSLLYDTGPRYSADSDAGRWIIVPLLRALGVDLDAVVVSHRDSDHSGGTEAVRAGWPNARWLSSYDTESVRRCVAGQHWEWDGVRFEVLHPAPDNHTEDGRGRLSSNAMSCVLLIKSTDQSAWLSGDLDAARETRLALDHPELRATVMLAPHHGSRTSSSPVLLNTLRPKWVLVQSGYRNRFGHPAPEVLDRYRQRGIPWVASPECGAARWRSAEPQVVHCERDEKRRYWQHVTGHADKPEDSGAESGANSWQSE
jgi:competence protein ComEC